MKPVDGHEERCRSSAESYRNASKEEVLCWPGFEPVIQDIRQRGQDEANQREHHGQFPTIPVAPRPQEKDDQHRRDVLYQRGAHAQVGDIALDVIIVVVERGCGGVVVRCTRGCVQMEIDTARLLQEQVLHHYRLDNPIKRDLINSIGFHVWFDGLVL